MYAVTSFCVCSLWVIILVVSLVQALFAKCSNSGYSVYAVASFCLCSLWFIILVVSLVQALFAKCSNSDYPVYAVASFCVCSLGSLVHYPCSVFCFDALCVCVCVCVCKIRYQQPCAAAKVVSERCTPGVIQS